MTGHLGTVHLGSAKGIHLTEKSQSLSLILINELLEDHGLRAFLGMLLCHSISFIIILIIIVFLFLGACIVFGRSISFIIILIIIVAIVIIIHAYTVPRGSASSRFFRTAQIENGVNGSLTLTRD